MGNRLKLAVIRGHLMVPCEVMPYRPLGDFGIDVTGISSNDAPFPDSEIPLKCVRLFRPGSVNRIPQVSRVLQYMTGINYKLWGLKEVASNFDVLNPIETYNGFSSQAVDTGRPTVVTAWENIPYLHEHGPYRGFKENVRRKAAYFIAKTPSARHALISEGVDDERITVIPAGIDTKQFKPAKGNAALARQIGIPDDAKVLLFVGRFVPEKGIMFLIDAFSKLAAKDEKLHLMLRGSGPLEASIRERASQLGISRRIHMLGFVKYSQMPEYYNICDVFCLPSTPAKGWLEQFGFVLMEAMACGKPVVSTTSGSIPEVVTHGKAGLLVAHSDSDALASALGELLDDSAKRKRFGKAARELVLAQYDLDLVARKLAAVFKNVSE